MAITNYGDLKSQVAVMLNRNNLTTEIPYYVQLAETRIAYGSKEQPFPSDPLRIRAMEQCASASFAEQEVELPDDFLQIRRIFIAGQPNGRLKFRTPDNFWPNPLVGVTGMPKIFTEEGNSIFLGPTPDTAYTGKILYYKKFTALANDADTNWLLVNAPSVYLFGTLLEAYSHIRNMDEGTNYLNKFAGTVNALNATDKSDRFATPWETTSDNYTP